MRPARPGWRRSSTGSTASRPRSTTRPRRPTSWRRRRCPTRTSSSGSARPATPPAWRPQPAPPAADETRCCGAGCWSRWPSRCRSSPWRWSRPSRSTTGSGSARPGHAGRALGRLAVPSRRVDQPRHRATTMDTLISVGTLAAYGWSLYALLFGTVGEIGMRHAFELTVQRGEGSVSSSTSRPPRA